jgi:hypothetical protein
MEEGAECPGSEVAPGPGVLTGSWGLKVRQGVAGEAGGGLKPEEDSPSVVPALLSGTSSYMHMSVR